MKVTKLFSRKILVVPEMGNGAFMGPKSTLLKFSINFAHYVFLELYLITGINDWVKVTFFDFYGKFLLCPECFKCVIWSSTLLLSLKSDFHFPKKFFICFNGSPSIMMENAFYFIVKALFVLKIFTFLS